MFTRVLHASNASSKEGLLPTIYVMFKYFGVPSICRCFWLHRVHKVHRVPGVSLLVYRKLLLVCGAQGAYCVVSRVRVACLQLVIESCCWVPMQYVELRLHTVWYLVCGGLPRVRVACLQLVIESWRSLLFADSAYLACSRPLQTIFAQSSRSQFLCECYFSRKTLRLYWVPRDFYNFPAYFILERLAEVRWARFWGHLLH